MRSVIVRGLSLAASVVLASTVAAQERQSSSDVSAAAQERMAAVRAALAAAQEGQRAGGFVVVAPERVAVVQAAAAAEQERRATLEATFEYIAGEPALGAVVRGAPYSGEATTTVSQTLADGTRIERNTVTRLYRDSEGRVRREQTVLGLGPLSGPPGDTQPVVTITDPVAGITYVLDPNTRKARRLQAGRVQVRVGDKVEKIAVARGGDDAPPPPPPPPPPAAGVGGRGGRGRGAVNVANAPQSLGTRQIEGVTATGTKRTETIPVGRIGNDRPIEITDERWESPDLKLLVLSRHHDPRTGDVEYRLTNISRAEPPHDLFIVPPD
jgi:hypothetical protein